MSEFLDAVDKTTSEAAGGPWAHWPEAGSVEITSNKHSDVICGYVKPKSGWGGEVYEDGTEPTAEFIAQSRQWVPAMSAALREVLELHRPEVRYLVWGHEEVSFLSVEDAAEFVGHPVEAEGFKLCAECMRVEDGADDNAAEIGYETSLWPCPTVRAISDALGVETEGDEEVVDDAWDTWDDEAEDYATRHHTHEHLDTAENDRGYRRFIQGARWQRHQWTGDEAELRIAQHLYRIIGYVSEPWDTIPRARQDGYRKEARRLLTTLEGDPNNRAE